MNTFGIKFQQNVIQLKKLSHYWDDMELQIFSPLRFFCGKSNQGKHEFHEFQSLSAQETQSRTPPLLISSIWSSCFTCSQTIQHSHTFITHQQMRFENKGGARYTTLISRPCIRTQKLIQQPLVAQRANISRKKPPPPRHKRGALWHRGQKARERWCHWVRNTQAAARRNKALKIEKMIYSVFCLCIIRGNTFPGRRVTNDRAGRSLSSALTHITNSRPVRGQRALMISASRVHIAFIGPAIKVALGVGQRDRLDCYYVVLTCSHH